MLRRDGRRKKATNVSFGENVLDCCRVGKALEFRRPAARTESEARLHALEVRSPPTQRPSLPRHRFVRMLRGALRCEANCLDAVMAAHAHPVLTPPGRRTRASSFACRIASSTWSRRRRRWRSCSSRRRSSPPRSRRGLACSCACSARARSWRSARSTWRNSLRWLSAS